MKYLDFEVNIMKVIVSIVHKHSRCASNLTSYLLRLACMLHVKKVFYGNLVFGNVAVKWL